MSTAATPRLKLRRGRSTDQGTPGLLQRPDGSVLAYTLELPWRDNARQRSCIPPGTYRCRMVQSPRFGRVYEVAGVPGRTNILIHAANLAGDAELGWRTDLLGCIAPGLRRGTLRGQLAVLVSRPAVSQLEREMQRKPFTLEVVPWISDS